MCESEFPEIVTVRLFAQQQEPSSTALGSHAHGTQLTATQESGLRRESCATADRARGSIRYTRYYLMVMPDVRCGCARARLIVHSWPPRTGASIYVYVRSYAIPRTAASVAILIVSAPNTMAHTSSPI